MPQTQPWLNKPLSVAYCAVPNPITDAGVFSAALYATQSLGSTATDVFFGFFLKYSYNGIDWPDDSAAQPVISNQIKTQLVDSTVIINLNDGQGNRTATLRQWPQISLLLLSPERVHVFVGNVSFGTYESTGGPGTEVASL